MSDTKFYDDIIKKIHDDYKKSQESKQEFDILDFNTDAACEVALKEIDKKVKDTVDETFDKHQLVFFIFMTLVLLAGWFIGRHDSNLYLYMRSVSEENKLTSINFSGDEDKVVGRCNEVRELYEAKFNTKFVCAE